MIARLAFYPCLAGAWFSGHALAAPTVHRVKMTGVRFDPPTLEASVGDTIEWTNDDFVPHTATAADASFDSGKVDPEKTWKWTVTRKGTFPYKCIYHVTMKGSLVVK